MTCSAQPTSRHRRPQAPVSRPPRALLRLGRLIGTPAWNNLSLQQRERWLDLYLERL